MLEIPRKCLNVFAIFVEAYLPFFLSQGKNISFCGRVQSKKLVHGIVCEESFVIITEKKTQNHNPFSEGQNAGSSPGHVYRSGILEYSSLFIFSSESYRPVLKSCMLVLESQIQHFWQFIHSVSVFLIGKQWLIIPVLLSCGQSCR